MKKFFKRACLIILILIIIYIIYLHTLYDYNFYSSLASAMHRSLRESIIAYDPNVKKEKEKEAKKKEVFPFYYSDGLDMSKYYNPSISTIKQPVDDIAKDLIKLLFDIIAKKQEHQHKVYESELLVRESTSFENKSN